MDPAPEQLLGAAVTAVQGLVRQEVVDTAHHLQEALEVLDTEVLVLEVLGVQAALVGQVAEDLLGEDVLQVEEVADAGTNSKFQ
jgi:hypothetical protein